MKLNGGIILIWLKPWMRAKILKRHTSVNEKKQIAENFGEALF